MVLVLLVIVELLVEVIKLLIVKQLQQVIYISKFSLV